MPFARPSLTQLRNQAVQDITSSGIPGLDGLLRNAVLRVLAWVEAGLAYSLYGYLDWISRQSVPFTATDEYLESWAALVGIYRKDASAATGFATFSGAQGTVLPLGTALTRSDGVAFVTTSEQAVGADLTVTVAIEAALPGAVSNAPAGSAIALDNPIAGINASGSTGILTGGADQEDNDALRTRMLIRYREPPKGGSNSDYVDWALSVPGVTRVWIAGNGNGPGTVVVYPMLDAVNAAYGGFPQGTDGVATDETRAAQATGDQLAIADAIFPLQPITALVYVDAPAAAPLDVTIGTLEPATATIETQIGQALADMLLIRAEVGGVIYPSDIAEAILATPGVVHFTLVAPTTAFQAPANGLPILGTLTFQ